MSAQAKPSEPSMEEILASIRRIISDDEVKPAEAEQPAGAPIAPADEMGSLLAGAAAVVGPPPTPEPAPEPEPEPEDDILDLGAEAQAIAVPEAEPQADDLDFLEASEPVAAVPAPEPILAPEPIPEPVRMAAPLQASAPPPAFDMAQLLSDQASHSVGSAFGQLAHTVLSNNARTLEDLVKDMLKPMLKSWLDDNLPVMVERLVRAEIERVARGGRS
jgi:hypothetical protein